MSERVGRVRDWRRALPGKWSRQRMMEWKQRNRIPELPLPPGLEPGHPFLPFLCRAGRGYRAVCLRRCLAGAEAAERGRGRPTDPYFCLGPDSGVIICADPPRSLPPSVRAAGALLRRAPSPSLARTSFVPRRLALDPDRSARRPGACRTPFVGPCRLQDPLRDPLRETPWSHANGGLRTRTAA